MFSLLAAACDGPAARAMLAVDRATERPSDGGARTTEAEARAKTALKIVAQKSASKASASNRMVF